MRPSGAPAWTLFVQYPNREPVLRELVALQSLSELRDALEVFDDQHLQIADKQNPSEFKLVESIDQLYAGASLRVTVPRRRIFVSLEGGVRDRPVVWYPGASAEQIENAIVKACGLPLSTPIELLDGDVAVVISATIPNDLALMVVPLTPVCTEAGASSSSSTVPPQTNGGVRHDRPSLERGPESPRKRDSREGRASYTPTVPRTSGARNSSPSGRSGGPACSPGTPGIKATSSQGGTPLGPRDAGYHARSATASRAASPTPRDLSGPAPGDLVAQPPGKVSAPDEHCIHILAGHTGHVLSLCTVGDVLFTGSQDCSIMIWDLNNLQFIGTLPGHRGFVKCMAATLPRKMLCSGSQDKTIKVWSLESFSSTKTLYGHTSDVNTLSVLEGQEVLVSGGEDRSIRVWDLTTLSLLANLEQAHHSGVFTTAQLDNGFFLSASRDRTVKVWLAQTWQARRTLNPPHFDGVSDLAVGTNSGQFYSCSRDRSIRRWESKTFESDQSLAHAHGDWLTALALSPSNDILFSGSKDCVVKVWDSDLHCKDMLLGHKGAISALITIDGHLFSASHDRTVRVWRVDQYESGVTSSGGSLLGANLSGVGHLGNH